MFKQLKQHEFWQLKVVQPIFWGVFFLFHFLDNIPFYTLSHALCLAIAYTAIIYGLVHANVTYFIQQYFFKKKIFVYALLLMITTAIVASAYQYIAYHLPEFQTIEPIETLPIAVIDFVYAFIQCLILVTSISSVLIAFQQLKTKEELTTMQKEQVSTQLNYLQAQMNPHFLFNVLNNIHFLIEDEPKRASETLMKLSDLLRYQLYETNQEKVLLSQEIEHLTNYINLEKLRIGNQLTLITDFKNDNPTFQLPPFLLLPLVENAFKHSETNNQRLIEFHLSVEGNNLIFITKNTIGTKAKPTGGLGLENLKNRLTLLYPNRYKFSTTIADKLFITKLTLNQ